MKTYLLHALLAVAVIGHPPGTGTITVGERTYEIGQRAIQQSQIRLAPGTWRATGSVLLLVAADGSITVQVDDAAPLTVTGLVDGTTPTPVPPVDPVPGDPKLAALKRALPAKPSSGAAALAKLYRDTAALQLSSADQLKTVTNSLFSAVASAASNGPELTNWKAAVDMAVVQAGISTHAEHVSAWQLIAGHLE